jgi:hypothetical protein
MSDTVIQLAEKSVAAVSCNGARVHTLQMKSSGVGFVTGHEFTRAANTARSAGALAPEAHFSPLLRRSAGVAVVVLALALLGWGQYVPLGSTGAAQGQLARQAPVGEGPMSDLAWNAKRLRALNADRQKSMVSDAERLLKLARQLDAEVASNPGGELTPSELHKVAEIEKLAHSVKSKMVLSFSSGPQVRGSAMPDFGVNGP